MVKKGCRRRLNTGNTIRQYHRDPVLRQYQRYGCMVVDNGIEKRDCKAAKVMKDVTDTLPPKANGVELSLNKQRRWELPSYLKQKVELESDSKDVQITVLEHRMNVPLFRHHPIEEWENCTAYYSNVGVVRSCVSHSEMTIQSAMQGHRDEDHLTRLERRQFKKQKKIEAKSVEDVEVEELPSLPSYECRIAYGARTDGKFYMELATKPFARTLKKHKNQTSGCGKRYLSRNFYTDDDVSLYSDDDLADDFYDGDESYSSHLTSVPDPILSDFIVPSRVSKPERKQYVVVDQQ